MNLSRKTPGSLLRDKPTLFSPLVTRDLDGHGSQILGGVDLDTVGDISLGSSSSFRYDIPGVGLKSTQQLQVDWSQFSNHTFFQSAQAKTQVAFDKILNQFPFNGTKATTEEFLDKLTGFERWVYGNLPKNVGYLFFSGSNTGDTTAGIGSWFRVYDAAGVAFSGISENQTGQGYLDPGIASMTLETWFYLPAQANSNQVILSKVSSSANLATQHGWTLVLSQSAETTSCPLTFYVSSGSYLQSATITATKGSWQHLGVVWNRNPGVHKVFLYQNEVLEATSSNPVEIGFLDTRGTSLYVGTGSQVRTSTFVPQTTFSGALDELRIWHKVRSQTELQALSRRGIFSQDGLKGYWRFNEPPGVTTRLVVDHSGNDLHGEMGSSAIILGTKSYNTSSLPLGPMTGEDLEVNPVLFPQFPWTTGLRSTLLLSGSRFDLANPNLITKLVPRHYLHEGQVEDSLDTEEGGLLTDYQSGTDPRTGRLSPSQIMVLLLYTWAKHFDEIKLYLDAFGDLLSVDYDPQDTTPDQFLQWLSKQYGFNLPQMFRNSTVTQFIDGEDLGLDPGKSDTSLQDLQAQIWRRVLVNLQEIIRSKGTLSGVKSFIRCLGIDPDQNFRFREYGGPNKAVLEHSREFRSEVSAMLVLSGGGVIKSPYLSASRVEPGVPGTQGSFNPLGISTNKSDGLMTSGSWTWESTVKFDRTSDFWATQSLCRFYTTGANTIQGEGSLVANLVCFNPGTVCLYVKAGNTANLPFLKLELSGSTIMDGSPWYVSFGRNRAEEVNSVLSASYFLRIGKQGFGSLLETRSTSSLFHDTLGANIWSTLTGSWNASGSWFEVGTTSSVYTPANYLTNSFLNDSGAVPDAAARFTLFRGRMGQVRFWSKGLTETEWLEHVRNPKSLGVEDPLTNFNFGGRSVSGSWERLRLDVSMDQPVLSSSAGGTMTLWDFSQNNLHLTGSSLPASTPLILPERFWYSGISPRFDESVGSEKVRVRSFDSYSNVQSSSYAQVAPVYELLPSETPVDDTRFSIDFSVADTLNQDMIGLFSNLEFLDNALGNPELLFSPTYPDLDALREVYYNRLTGKVNLKSWFEFYKWFDLNAGWFIAQILPRKTKFLGVNYIVESSMCERAKVEYQWAEHYHGDSNRVGLKNPILMSLFSGVGRKF